jgi:hypothetical protein
MAARRRPPPGPPEPSAPGVKPGPALEGPGDAAERTVISQMPVFEDEAPTPVPEVVVAPPPRSVTLPPALQRPSPPPRQGTAPPPRGTVTRSGPGPRPESRARPAPPVPEGFEEPELPGDGRRPAPPRKEATFVGLPVGLGAGPSPQAPSPPERASSRPAVPARGTLDLPGDPAVPLRGAPSAGSPEPAGARRPGLERVAAASPEPAAPHRGAPSAGSPEPAGPRRPGLERVAASSPEPAAPRSAAPLAPAPRLTLPVPGAPPPAGSPPAPLPPAGLRVGPPAAPPASGPTPGGPALQLATRGAPPAPVSPGLRAGPGAGLAGSGFEGLEDVADAPPRPPVHRVPGPKAQSANRWLAAAALGVVALVASVFYSASPKPEAARPVAPTPSGPLARVEGPDGKAITYTPPAPVAEAPEPPSSATRARAAKGAPAERKRARQPMWSPERVASLDKADARPEFGSTYRAPVDYRRSYLEDEKPPGVPTLQVFSHPPGMALKINGQLEGRTPYLKPLYGEVKRMEVELSGAGFLTQRSTLTPDKDGTFRWNAVMALDPNGPPARPPAWPQ